MVQFANSTTAVVLVVEDEPLIMLGSVQIVEDLGYIALQATNADEAIVLLEAHPEIVIVFTDIQMAGSMDGLALSNWAANRWPPLRFIIVSGGMRPRLVDMPTDAVFLAKPFKSSAIGRAIEGFRAAS
ncbi:response regulator [Novosphingobium sp. AP12]|uniref:response regulator n=1 Tax=Novosphingobium sp. AP12 TaxID=1144305 RepID=UPI0002721A58|nr:response regulator [Novosphingobium sp. AP12]EJL22173.1 response regulator containing CheY-like receiver domain and AraC-type DNA-binding domain [Novosphingobium sp. AP12]